MLVVFNTLKWLEVIWRAMGWAVRESRLAIMAFDATRLSDVKTASGSVMVRFCANPERVHPAIGQTATSDQHMAQVRKFMFSSREFIYLLKTSYIS
jgi:hypothetical protein